MAGRKSDFTLPTLDDLFSTQEMRDDAKLAKIRDIPLELIDDFPDHPFKVRDDEDMLLFYRYYNRFADYLRAGELPLEDLAYNYKAYGLPCFESIRRARQRVQSLFPELSRNSANEQDGSVVIVININGG